MSGEDLDVANCIQTNFEALNEYLANGVDPSTYGRFHRSLLFHAVAKKNERAVRLLINAGADVNASDLFQVSPLIFAIFNGHDTIAKMLIDAGADVHSGNARGYNALHLAAGRGRSTEILNLLLTQKAMDVNVRSPKDGATPVFLAFHTGRIELAEWLLKAGADVNIADASDTSILHHMAKDHRIDRAQLLLDHGASATRVNRYGSTPLIWAIREPRNIEMVKLLTEYGAHPHIGCDIATEMTPYEWACYNEDQEALRHFRQWPRVPTLRALCLYLIQRRKIPHEHMSPGLFVWPLEQHRRPIPTLTRKRSRSDDTNDVNGRSVRQR